MAHRRSPALRLAIAVASTAAALALVLASCGSGGDEADEPTEVSLSEATEVDASTTTAPDATSTTAAIATTGLGTQEDAVRTLYDAWYADDKVTAATVAEQTAIDGMWKTARGDYSLYSACATGEFDTSGCLYRGANGTIQFTVERRGDFWVVIEAFYSAP